MHDIVVDMSKVYKGFSEFSRSSTIAPHQRVLSELLSQIEPINFRECAELDEDVKLTRKITVVISVDKVLEVATSNNWGLCTKNNFIYVFNGEYWQPLDADAFKTFLADAAIRLGVPILDAKYHLYRDELYRQFLSVSYLPAPETGKKVLINLLNGTFEITKDRQELRERRREDFLKYQLPFEYDPDASCPIFDKYLHRVVPDEDCQKVLAEYLGYIFTGDLKLEKALILYGSGANGKSVFFDIINALLGEENISSYSLQNLTKYDSYQRSQLQNKLLNYASEINGRLETSIFKQLVSGEPVEARQIYCEPFIMRDYAKLAFNCNELPKEVEQTDAFFRRFIIVPFDQTIPEDEQDPDLAKKIITSELSGVFNWILVGLRRLLSQKRFTQSKKIKEQVEKYRKESDSVAMFMDDEGYKPSINKFVLLKTMYENYKEFCLNSGYHSCSIQTMSGRLKKCNYDVEKKTKGVCVYAEK